MKREFEWNDQGQLTYSGDLYFNQDSQTWDGCYAYYGKEMYNKRTIYNYDSANRITDETYSEAHSPGVYTKMSDIIHIWSDIEDGGTQCISTSTVYQEDKDPVVQDITTKHYNATGRLTYMQEQHIQGATGPLVDYMMQAYEYDSKGNLSAEYSWTPNRDEPGEWIGVIGIIYTYDENGNCIEKSTLKGLGGYDDWINNNRFTYKYGNDNIPVEEMAYRWKDSEWMPNYGNGWIYDFSVKVSEIVTWPGADFEYKLDEVRSYSGTDGEWDWMSNIYYYSDIETSGVAEVSDRDLSISYDGHMVSVIGDDTTLTRIFDTTGRIVLTSPEKTIDLSNLSSGVYVVTSNGMSKKILKK